MSRPAMKNEEFQVMNEGNYLDYHLMKQTISNITPRLPTLFL